jgi:hypothetical protein
MKNKLIITFVLSFVLAAGLIAQEGEVQYGWHKTAVANLNFTQNKFDNWMQGGEDSWSWVMKVDGSMNRLQENSEWTNTLKFTFGQSQIGDADAIKAADELYLESVYSWLMGWYLDPYAAATAKTQLTKGYLYQDDADDIVISDLLDPGYFTQSVGVGFKPNDNFKTRFGGAIKETISKDYGYADDPDTDDEIEENKVEYGVESVTDVNYLLMESILFTSKLEAFSNLESFDKIDVNWDNLFTAQVNSLINVSLNIKVFYDHDISSKRQLQQTLAVGFNYTLF